MIFTKGELTTGNNYSMYHWIVFIADFTKTFHWLLPVVMTKIRQKIKVLAEIQNYAFITNHNLTFVICDHLLLMSLLTMM